VIAAHEIVVRAGVATLLDGVSLDVAPGVTGIVGPNGAGKSTLLGALAGDRRVARGRVTCGDRDLRALAPGELARLRAVLPQRSQLTLAFTALEVVQLGGHGISALTAHACLEAVELGGLAEREYPTLSGGEQQRVQLARVLAQLERSPGSTLLLDEPTSALDPRHQRVVFAHARRVAERGHPVAIVVHDLTLAARWCDQIAVMAKGRIVATGTPREALTPEILAAAYATRFEILVGTGGLVVSTS
jgi:iron complex transport system ATP-binding protein